MEKNMQRKKGEKRIQLGTNNTEHINNKNIYKKIINQKRNQYKEKRWKTHNKEDIDIRYDQRREEKIIHIPEDNRKRK